jgi:DNA-binding NarL/FixJ family response regulator
MLPTLRVLLALDEAIVDDWLDALDPLVMVVDSLPDVVLADRDEAFGVPVVTLGDGEGAGSRLSADTDPETVVAALFAASHGLQVRSVADGPVVPHLTPREQEVLELLALGLSNKEIGAALQISAHTAKFHVQGLLEKLDATTRTEAAVRAARQLLI